MASTAIPSAASAAPTQAKRGLGYTNEAKASALKNNAFVSVGPAWQWDSASGVGSFRERINPGRHQFGGSVKVWKQQDESGIYRGDDRRIIYIPLIRITGTVGSVREALLSMKGTPYTADDVESFIQNGFQGTDDRVYVDESRVMTFEEYFAEFEQSRLEIKENKEISLAFTERDLKEFIAASRALSAKSVFHPPGAPSRRSPTPTLSATRRSPPNASIATRYNLLDGNEVINVSDPKAPRRGTPRNNPRSLRNIPGTRLVSSTASGFNAALDSLQAEGVFSPADVTRFRRQVDDMLAANTITP